MSYDIYCYKSKTGIPDEVEAGLIIETDIDKWAIKDRDANTKLSIVKALINYNPRLEVFDFDYGDIAKLAVSTIEEAKNKFDHIEVNAKEGEFSVQLTVYDNHVFITVPYSYKGAEAKKLFQDLNSYIKIIREIAGYFVYDPQSGKSFDPSKKVFDGLEKYLSVSEHIEDVIGIEKPINPHITKPWWKFWQ